MTPAIDPEAVRFDPQGLVPAVIQDRASGDVLMVGYMNRESLQATVRSGLVTFWSRSRQELWEKGATSGNQLRLVDIVADCDQDALLVRVVPTGPACHLGIQSCFGNRSPQGFRRLEELWSVIVDRLASRPADSYTVELASRGVNATTRKLTEEATEVLLAAKDHAAGVDDGQLARESADLLYHLLVVLAERGEAPAAVLDALDERRS